MNSYSIKNKKLTILGGIVALTLAIIDQATKQSIIEYFSDPLSSSIEVNEYFNIVLAWNKGISFGLFAGYDYSNIIFSIIALIAVSFLGLWLTQNKKLNNSVAIGLVIGGAIGNIIDRIQYKAVADFIELHINQYYWPAFNIADASICIGVAMLAMDSLAHDIKKVINEKK